MVIGQAALGLIVYSVNVVNRFNFLSLKHFIILTLKYINYRFLYSIKSQNSKFFSDFEYYSIPLFLMSQKYLSGKLHWVHRRNIEISQSYVSGFLVLYITLFSYPTTSN